MTIDDLLALDPRDFSSAEPPETNALTEDDALQEAQVLDVRFEALSGVAGILFELRQALQLRQGNTGVVVARGVRELAWSTSSRDTTMTAWSVGSSAPRVRGGLFNLSLVMWPHPGAQLTLTCESAAFVVGEVPGLPDTPPDYTLDDPSAVATELTGWNSPFELMGAVFLDPAASPRWNGHG